MKQLIDTVQNTLNTVLSPDQITWLNTTISDCIAKDDVATAMALSSAKIRRKMPVKTLPECTLETPAGSINLKFWTAAEAARICLYHALIIHKSVDVPTLYAWGDDKERMALLKAISIFDHTGELLEFAIDVGRTNSVDLYSAIALNNPYPAKFYSDHQFTQLVTKCLFIKLNIEYVQHLAERRCAELAKVSAYYVQEILDANREIPPSIWLAVCPDAVPEGVAFLSRFIADENPSHRLYVAYALTREATLPDELKAAVAARKAVEDDDRVLAFLNQLN